MIDRPMGRLPAHADRRSRGTTWIASRGVGILLAACALVAARPASAAVLSRAQQKCVVGLSKAFSSVARAQRKTIAWCLEHARDGVLAPQRVDDCVTADGGRFVAAATTQTLALDAKRCGAPPEFGYAGADSVVAEAVASELALARDVFGADLDATVAEADPQGAACQTKLLRQAGLCARELTSAFIACGKTALRGSRTRPPIDGPLGLVRCKGSDPKGRIDRACSTKLGDVVRGSCTDVDVQMLVPGCAGKDLTACVRGYAQARASRGLNGATGLCSPPGPPPPAPEPIDLHVVPLPPDVTTVQFPWWTEDGSRLVFSARITGYDAVQIATIAPDGTDFRCLTCPLAAPGDPPLLKPIPFPDGTRVMLRVGNQSPISAADHAVLECTPSVLDCQTAVLVPIVVPAAADPNVTQDQREFRVARDGVHVGFSQVRRDPAGGEALIAIVGILERLADHYEVADPRVVSPIGELKQFGNDDQSVYVLSIEGSPPSVANADTMRVALADGAVSRLTRYPDYDEPVEFSLDDDWYVVGSGRGSGLVATVAQVPRSPMVNRYLSRVTAHFFVTMQAPLLEPWLIDRHGDRGDYIGQALRPGGIAEGWDARPIFNWHPDGTRIAWSEVQIGGSATRLVVAHLSSRAPIASPVVPHALPSLSWAPPLAGYVPPAPSDPASTAGAVSGTAHVTFTPGATDLVEITYTDYSDDGAHFVDGTERIDSSPGLGGTLRYDADLRLHGCRQGFLAATGAEFTIASFAGAVVSEVDGNLLALPR